MDFTEIFKELIKEKGTAYRLSKATKISEGLISDYKSGRSKPSIENLNKIAKYFNITTDYLSGLSDNPSSLNFLSDDEHKIINAYRENADFQEAVKKALEKII